jgi:SNF2 family DNA or RNA helicase
MTPTQRKVYRDLKRDYVAWMGDGTEVVAWNDAAKHVRLDKIATGLGGVTGVWKESESGKLQQLLADLNGRSRPTLVVGYYQETVDGLAAFCEKKLGLRAEVIHGGTSRPARGRIVADFKAGRVDALFATIDTIAEGLTLVQADCVILVEKGYVPSKVTQAIRRVHRLGQERPVTIRDYVTPDSVDKNKRDSLMLKADRQVRHLTAADLAAIL